MKKLLTLTAFCGFFASPAIADVYCLGSCSSYYSFCRTPSDWCDRDSGTTHGMYPYCIMNGGTMLRGDTGSEWVVCFEDEDECLAVKDGIFKKTSAYQEVALYAWCSRTGSTDQFDSISCCDAGRYSTTDWGCAVKYKSSSSISCQDCPAVTDVYTDAALTTLATTTSPGASIGVESCYLPAGTYYNASGTFEMTSKCDY